MMKYHGTFNGGIKISFFLDLLSTLFSKGKNDKALSKVDRTKNSIDAVKIYPLISESALADLFLIVSIIALFDNDHHS